MLDRLVALKWQILFAAAAAAFTLASGSLVLTKIEGARLAEANAVLDARINDPKTGYVRQIAQAQTNTEQVRTALSTQLADLQRKADADARKLAETARRLEAVQREADSLRRLADTLAAYQPQGDTLEARVLDADARVLEMLRK